ncbi:hypothetical protein HGM15179_001826 [Zosterops borbonicus]|uniref:Uncharacterized protein n=1 Tax=Zosterops borbonicus TaxID=364589 RepID=A0A8K1LT91_9PASS|nr:hypothetical protein HGM15179_001826 [Zosterops borbonicus]
MEMLYGLEPLCFGPKLGDLGVFTQRRVGSRETSEPLSVPKGAPGELERAFGQGLECQDKEEWLPTVRGWDIGKGFLPVRMVKPWHRVPREAVAAPCLEVSRARLDGAWSNVG